MESFSCRKGKVSSTPQTDSWKYKNSKIMKKKKEIKNMKKMRHKNSQLIKLTMLKQSDGISTFIKAK